MLTKNIFQKTYFSCWHAVNLPIQYLKLSLNWVLLIFALLRIIDCFGKGDFRYFPKVKLNSKCTSCFGAVLFCEDSIYPKQWLENILISQPPLPTNQFLASPVQNFSKLVVWHFTSISHLLNWSLPRIIHEWVSILIVNHQQRIVLQKYINRLCWLNIRKVNDK